MTITASGLEVPGLRDPEKFARELLAACNADMVFRSRRAQWIAAHPYEVSGLDFLQAVLAPARNAGTLPSSFPNFASHLAYVLGLPYPEPPARPFPAIARDRFDGAMKIQED